MLERNVPGCLVAGCTRLPPCGGQIGIQAIIRDLPRHRDYVCERREIAWDRFVTRRWTRDPRDLAKGPRRISSFPPVFQIAHRETDKFIPATKIRRCCHTRWKASRSPSLSDISSISKIGTQACRENCSVIYFQKFADFRAEFRVLIDWSILARSIDKYLIWS